MPVVACIHHLERPTCGLAAPPLRARGLVLDERAPIRAGDPLPALEEVDAILALGGEQSVVAIAREPELQAEAALLRAAVERGVPVLGVCLGAQLLAHALGGRVRRLERRRADWTPLEPLAAAAGDPLFGSLPAGAAGLFWNEDGLELPPDAVELVRRTGAAVAAFRAGATAWGIQFHPEIDAAALEHWYRDWPYIPVEAGVEEAAARRADARHLPAQPALAEAIFGGFARVVCERAAAARPAA